MLLNSQKVFHQNEFIRTFTQNLEMIKCRSSKYFLKFLRAADGKRLGNTALNCAVQSGCLQSIGPCHVSISTKCIFFQKKDITNGNPASRMIRDSFDLLPFDAIILRNYPLSENILQYLVNSFTGHFGDFVRIGRWVVISLMV